MFLFTLCDFAAVFNILRFLAPSEGGRGGGSPCIKGDSENIIHHAAIDAQRGAGGGRRLRRADVDHHIGDLCHRGRPLDHRARTMGHNKRFRLFLQRLAGFRHVVFSAFRQSRRKSLAPGRTLLTVTPLPATYFAEAAGQRQLRGLGDAIVDHVRRDIARRF